MEGRWFERFDMDNGSGYLVLYLVFERKAQLSHISLNALEHRYDPRTQVPCAVDTRLHHGPVEVCRTHMTMSREIVTL